MATDTSKEKTPLVHVYLLTSSPCSPSSASLHSDFTNQSPLTGKLPEGKAYMRTSEGRNGGRFLMIAGESGSRSVLRPEAVLHLFFFIASLCTSLQSLLTCNSKQNFILFFRKIDCSLMSGGKHSC